MGSAVQGEIKPDLNPVKSAKEFSGLWCCLPIMRKGVIKAGVYYSERADVWYHWYTQDKVKKNSCSTDMNGI